ncbi:MAG: stage II sporulation protein M, partial [Bacteroidia bacterium]
MVPPDKIAELFIEVTDDLAFARTHYPGSTTTQYLNGLAGQLHQAIVKNKKVKSSAFFNFWTTELPEIMFATRHKLLYAFTIFMVAVVIGALSTNYDINFVRSILGDNYVDHTIENIENGEPLGIYAEGGEIDMFLAITVNNIKVSMFAFVAGLLLSVGTALILFQNGIMVGAFFSFLFQYGFAKETLLTVFIHGTLELSAIVIAGSAGFQVGHSILFPGTYSRLESLKQGALRGVKIVLGLIPVFIAAGFLEGFVTRHTEMPAVASLAIIVGSAAFISYYFIIYPMQLQAAKANHLGP